MVGRIGGDETSVRPGLAAWFYTGTLVLNERAWPTEAPIFLDRQHFDAASAVIGHKDVFSRPVHYQMARGPSPPEAF